MTNSHIRRLNVRMSEHDYKALARMARASGLTISDFVRFRCLEDDGRPRIVVDAETLKALYANERRIGGLLNQLLRHANARHQDFPELAGQAQAVLAQLEESTRQVSELIAEARASA
jgi:hypothetical protein